MSNNHPQVNEELENFIIQDKLSKIKNKIMSKIVQSISNICNNTVKI